ncbi:fucose permease [Clostridium algifaecis]|uniref:Fucose permease n=1 Tax=Clostridium algifaecis TaxID=1472040 RepID=A0ABS4KWH9_9CLOT|nr:MFS transporter [Clostridium algifaecis]MBP2033264.1 fucose permease [Clostridium algifaecis]
MNKDLKNMIIVFLGSFLLSLFSNTMSPFITTIEKTYNLSGNTIAILPPVVYFASFVMSIVGAKLMPALGIKKGIYTGFSCVIFSSFIILISRSFYVLLFGYFIAGLAIGMNYVFLSAMLSLLPKRYQKFGLYNACFGLGGILILPIDRFVLRNGMKFNYTYIIHIVLMCLFVIIATKIDDVSLNDINNVPSSKFSFSVLKKSFVLLLSIAIFFYVGAEISTTNWTGGFLEKYYGMSKAEVPNILSGFWILFTFGRAVGDKFLYKVGRLEYLSVAPLIAIIGIFIILSGTSKIQALIGIGIIGLTMSLIYPALQGHIIQNVERKDITSTSSVMVIFNNFGAMFLTYMIGFAGGIKITYVFIIQIVFYVYIFIVSVHYLVLKKK